MKKWGRGSWCERGKTGNWYTLLAMGGSMRGPRVRVRGKLVILEGITHRFSSLSLSLSFHRLMPVTNFVLLSEPVLLPLLCFTKCWMAKDTVFVWISDIAMAKRRREEQSQGNWVRGWNSITSNPISLHPYICSFAVVTNGYQTHSEAFLNILYIQLHSDKNVPGTKKGYIKNMSGMRGNRTVPLSVCHFNSSFWLCLHFLSPLLHSIEYNGRDEMDKECVKLEDLKTCLRRFAFWHRNHISRGTQSFPYFGQQFHVVAVSHDPQIRPGHGRVTELASKLRRMIAGCGKNAKDSRKKKGVGRKRKKSAWLWDMSLSDGLFGNKARSPFSTHN